VLVGSFVGGASLKHTTAKEVFQALGDWKLLRGTVNIAGGMERQCDSNTTRVKLQQNRQSCLLTAAAAAAAAVYGPTQEYTTC
jgi:hypothetical protein